MSQGVGLGIKSIAGLSEATRSKLRRALANLDDLNKGIDPAAALSEQDAGRALSFAAQWGDEAMARELASLGAPLDWAAPASGQCALVNALLQDQTAMARVLLELGADPSRRGGANFTPLMAACWRGDEEGTRLLIQAGARLNDQDDAGDSALAKAATRGKEGCAKALLEAGADPALPDGQGQTPLMKVALIGSVGCVEALAAGSALEARDSLGRRAIHFAAEGGSLECVQALLGLGADPLALTDEGKSLADLAEAGGSGRPSKRERLRQWAAGAQAAWREAQELSAEPGPERPAEGGLISRRAGL